MPPSQRRMSATVFWRVVGVRVVVKLGRSYRGVRSGPRLEPVSGPSWWTKYLTVVVNRHVCDWK